MTGIGASFMIGSDIKDRKEWMLDGTMSDLIGLVYEAALRPDLWPEVMRQLTLAAPSAIATFFAHDMLSRQPAFQAQFGIEPFYLHEYVVRWAATNPIVEAMHRMQPGQVASLDMIMDYDAFTHSPFFREWGRPQGYVDAANIMLERTPTRVASISLIRHDRQGRMDAKTLGRLTLLAPHFLRSVRIGHALDFATVRSNALEASLDVLAMPVVLLDAGGDVAHANRGAQALFADLLPYDLVAAALRRQAATTTAVAGERCFALDATDGARYVCHWTPLDTAARGRAASILVIRSAVVIQAAAKAVSAAFGLTRRETDVLFAVMELGGGSVAAATLGLGKETIRAHLRSIFSKTQTHSQLDLLRLVTQHATPFLPAGA